MKQKRPEPHLINDTTANTSLVSCLGKYCVHIVLIMYSLFWRITAHISLKIEKPMYL